MTYRWALVALGALLVANCGGDATSDGNQVSSGATGGADCPDGTEGCPCYGNGTCNDDLVCASELCISLEGIGGRAAVTGGRGGTGNAATGGIPIGSGATGGAAPSSGGTGGEASGGEASGGDTGGEASGGDSSGGGTGGDETGGTSGGVAGGDAWTGGAAGGGAWSGGAGAGGDAPGTGGALVIPTDACNGMPYDEVGGACLGVGQEAEPVPVDILLDMDRSMSMGYEVTPGVRRLDQLSEAIGTFAADPDAADVGLGMVFFRATGATSEDEWCDPVSYETPDVPIGLVDETADEIVAAIEAAETAALTPSVPALEGAVTYARRHAVSNLGRATVVALVSDAFPTECNTDPSAQGDIAQAAYEGDPSIPVYVIGVGASARFNLDNVARAGGTREALMTEDETAVEDFVAALRNIVLSDLQCEFLLPEPPEGLELAVDRLQMVYAPFSGSTEEMPYVGSLEGCATTEYGGWYLDDPNNPTTVRTCPCTCARFGAGTLELRVGCAPALPVP